MVPPTSISDHENSPIYLGPQGDGLSDASRIRGKRGRRRDCRCPEKAEGTGTVDRRHRLARNCPTPSAFFSLLQPSSEVHRHRPRLLHLNVDHPELDICVVLLRPRGEQRNWLLKKGNRTHAQLSLTDTRASVYAGNDGLVKAVNEPGFNIYVQQTTLPHV